MDRLISEQKAIEAINDYWGEMETPTIDGYINAIKTIPSAEPSGDLISRQAALKIIDGWYYNNRDTENIEDLIILITYMASVNPQEPTGHWIRQTDDYHDYYECEYCGIAVGLDDIKNFCPNCGARMVEPQESEG